MGLGRAAHLVREATRYLEAGVSGAVFPGATAAVAFREEGRWTVAEAAGGKLSWKLPKNSPRSFYDLASVTKSFTAVTALRLVDAGKLRLESRVVEILPELTNPSVDEVTLDDLLRHHSGLSDWGGFYLDVPHELGSGAAKRWILSEAARRGQHARGSLQLYSDLGYLIAGEMVTRASGGDFAKTMDTWVQGPIGALGEVFFGGSSSTLERRALLARSSAPTEDCDWRGRVLRGEVHDENCAAYGGASGHAGLFGTASGVAHLGTALLDVLAGRSDFLKKETLEAALTRRLVSDRYVAGFDTKSEVESSAGRRMSPSTFGHLGFTGTSYWCDPENEIVIVLLSNRVHPSRANQKIRAFRPAFHDAMFTVATKAL